MESLLPDGGDKEKPDVLDMPKLLQINICNAMLSTGKIAEDISKVASRHGWETYTAWGRFAKPSISKQFQVGGIWNTYTHYAAHKLFDREGLVSKYATRKLIKKIEEIKPDIIHLHVIHDHYLNYPLLFEYLAHANTHVVWTLHDCWAFTGGCMYYDMQNCEKWKNGCNACPEHRAILCDNTEKQYTLKRHLLSNIKNLTFVPVSDWLGEALRESHHKYRPIKTIHNGIDISLFRPLCEKKKDGKFRIIGVAGVWAKRKGLDDFVRLRTMLPSEYEITLIGLSDKQIKRMPNGIKGISRTTDIKELAQLYSESDVYVNPTYSDTFPTTNIEALACGTPVITYKTGGSPEAIDEKTGTVVEQGDMDGLVSAIKQMKKEPLSPSDCRRRAEEHFDKDKCFEKYIELYNELIEK